MSHDPAHVTGISASFDEICPQFSVSAKRLVLVYSTDTHLKYLQSDMLNRKCNSYCDKLTFCIKIKKCAPLVPHRKVNKIKQSLKYT